MLSFNALKNPMLLASLSAVFGGRHGDREVK